MTRLLHPILLSAVAATVALGGPAHALARSNSGVPRASNAYGISAQIAQISASDISTGHVAGWVGVGGPGEGPNGSNEWLRVGYAGFPSTTGINIYYEVALPGTYPSHHQVSTGVAVGTYTKMTVLEMHGRANWWRVWVNHKPVSPPIRLPESHDGLMPTATSENSDGTTGGQCNNSLYRFHHVSIAGAPGGDWQQRPDC